MMNQILDDQDQALMVNKDILEVIMVDENDNEKNPKEDAYMEDNDEADGLDFDEAIREQGKEGEEPAP